MKSKLEEAQDELVSSIKEKSKNFSRVSMGITVPTVDAEWIEEMIKSKFSTLRQDIDDTSALDYLEQEFDFLAENMSQEEKENMAHFAECFAKYVNFNLK